MTTISYWQKTVGLPNREVETAAQRHLTADVCIVGGGIVGSSAAYHLARRGLTAVVVEAREPALGASGRNAGMIVAGIAGKYSHLVARYGRETAKKLWQFTVDNREATLALARELGVPIARTGSLTLADSPEEAAELAQSARLLEEDGFAVDYRPQNPLGRGFYNALGDPHNAATNPAKLVHALLKAGRQPVLTHAPVSRFEPHGAGMRVYSQKATVDCRFVFLAANAYAPQLHPFFADKIQPCRGQIQLTAPAPMVLARGCSSRYGYYYFRQIPEPENSEVGRWLIGGARNVNFAAENGHYGEAITGEVQSALAAFTAQYFPELAGAAIEHRWAGTMGFTQDHMPLVGVLPDRPQVTYCVGFSGHGMALAFKTAEQALELMLGERPATIFNEIAPDE